MAIYERNGEIALLAIHRQGMLTILEIWAGARLAEGAMLSSHSSASGDDNEKSLPGEEYGPLEQGEKQEGMVETWGGNVEERDL